MKALPEAQKLDLIYSAKYLNRMSSDPAALTSALEKHGFNTHRCFVVWTLRAQLTALQSTLQNPDVCRQLNDDQLEHLHAVVAILENAFKDSVEPLTALSPAANKLCQHYLGLGNAVEGTESIYLPALSKQELQQNLKDIVDEEEKKGVSKNIAFIDFMNHLKSQEVISLIWRDIPSVSKSAEPLKNQTVPSRVPPSFSRPLHQDDSLNFNEYDNKETCEKAIANLKTKNISGMLSTGKKRSLLHDLNYIISLANPASSAALPTTLEQAVERATSSLPAALQRSNTLSEEEKLHLLYAIKRINRMSVDYDAMAQKIRSAVIPRGIPVDFPTGPFDTYTPATIQHILQDPEFAGRATQQQQDHLAKMSELLLPALSLTNWVQNNMSREAPPLNLPITRANMDALQQQINQICKAHFFAAAKDSGQSAPADVLTPEALEAATMELGSTINTLIETLQPIDTPQSQELQQLLRDVDNAINPGIDYILK